MLLCVSTCGIPHRLVRVTTFRCPDTSVSCMLLGTAPNFRWALRNPFNGLVNILLPAVVVSAVLLSTSYLRGPPASGVRWHLATDLKKLLTWNILLCSFVFRVSVADLCGLHFTNDRGSVLQLVRRCLLTVVQLLLASYR